jgi:hypothetical protein
VWRFTSGPRLHRNPFESTFISMIVRLSKVRTSGAHLLAAIACGGFILSGCFSSSQTPAPTLVEKSNSGAALIQWVSSGNHLSGTYDSVYSEYGNDAYLTGQTKCAVNGVSNGSAITVTLTACSDANDDGTYSGQLSNSHLSIAVPTQSGAIRELEFVPGTLRTYDRAVVSTHLLVMQQNALRSYLVDSPPSDACGKVKASPLFETAEGAEVIVFRNTNTICTNFDFRAEFDVLRWFNFTDSWDPIASLQYQEIGGPQSYAPIDLGPGIRALKIKEETMLGPAYQVLADIDDKWQFIPFDAPGVKSQVQSKEVAYGATSITSNLSVVMHYRVCGQTSCANRIATLHYDSTKVAFVP